MSDRETALKALTEYVMYHGAVHSEECPEDDTCDCLYAPLNAGVNAAIRLLALSTPDAEVCAWREIGDFFTSGCDVNTDVCTDDPSFWSGWDFCPYCGQPLELAPSQETPA